MFVVAALSQQYQSMPGQVSTWVTHCWDVASWYVTSHAGQLSLAIPLWVGAMSTSDAPCDALASYLWSGSVNWCV